MSGASRVRIEGYTMILTGHDVSDGKTAITLCVSGNGHAAAEMTSWMLIHGNAEAGIISCEKRQCGGAWVPAVAQKPTYELTGQMISGGAVINEWVGRGKDDPAIEFRITFDQPIEDTAIRLAYITEDTIHQSTETIYLGPPEGAPRVWQTPIEKPFCLYFVVTDGYKPDGPCKAGVSITKRGAYMALETQMDAADERCVKAQLLGSVKIMASLPLKSHQACGGSVAATACDCFELCETIGYSCEDDTFSMRDISICPKMKSLDLTLLNAHCGRSVYRMDGKYIIDCKRCEAPCCPHAES